MNCKEKHVCHCGTSSVKEGGHKIGENGCVRYLTESPENFGKDPETDIDMWLVDGNFITEYDLKFSRMYWEHECGCWSRA